MFLNEIVTTRQRCYKKKEPTGQVLHAVDTGFMRDMLNAGYAVKEPTAQVNRQKKGWYIPHHRVFHPQKKKIRVAFDCAASYQGVSLDSKILQGPDPRVAAIRDATKPHQWKYVNTSINPSDCASRGLTPTKFMETSSWFHGPAFLRKLESQWPDKIDKRKDEEDDSEVRIDHRDDNKSIPNRTSLRPLR